MFILAFFVLLTSCTSDQKYREDTTESLKTNKAKIETDSGVVEQAEALPKEEITVKTLGNTIQTMAYDKSHLQVRAGTMVKLTLINEAQHWDMMHNIVITTMGQGPDIARAGTRVGAPGKFVPDLPAVIAASPIAKPGQTVTFEFKAPPPGEYDFICTYPNHYNRMNGKLTVK